MAEHEGLPDLAGADRLLAVFVEPRLREPGCARARVPIVFAIRIHDSNGCVRQDGRKKRGDNDDDETGRSGTGNEEGEGGRTHALFLSAATIARRVASNAFPS